MIPISKLRLGQSAILVRIGGGSTALQRLLRYGLQTGAPISRYAMAFRNQGGVWRQGSLLIALREKDAAVLFCNAEDDPHE